MPVLILLAGATAMARFAQTHDSFAADLHHYRNWNQRRRTANGQSATGRRVVAPQTRGTDCAILIVLFVAPSRNRLTKVPMVCQCIFDTTGWDDYEAVLPVYYSYREGWTPPSRNPSSREATGQYRQGRDGQTLQSWGSWHEDKDC